MCMKRSCVYAHICVCILGALHGHHCYKCGKKKPEASTQPSSESEQETSQGKQQSIAQQMTQISGAKGNLCATASPPQNFKDILPRAIECQGTPKQTTKHSTANEANKRDSKGQQHHDGSSLSKLISKLDIFDSRGFQTGYFQHDAINRMREFQAGHHQHDAGFQA